MGLSVGGEERASDEDERVVCRRKDEKGPSQYWSPSKHISISPVHLNIGTRT
jgi:hypothetical protein